MNTRISTVLCLLLGVMAILVVGATRADPGSGRRSASVFVVWEPLSAAALDRMRGGFVDLSGLKISFGLERMVFVNGELVQSLTFTVPDLTSLRKGSIGAVSVQGPAILPAPQPAPAGPIASTPTALTPQPVGDAAATAAASPSASAPAASTLQQAQVAASTLPTPASSAGTTVAPGAAASVVQIGPGNVVMPEVLNNLGPGVLTVVQNSLNGQAIQGLTVLNARVSGIGDFMRNSTLMDLRLTIRGAGR